MPEPAVVHARPRGLVLRGRIWPGAGDPVLPFGVVVIDATGRVAALGPAHAVGVPADLPDYGDAQTWIGPGLVDAHVHLMFGAPDEMARGGVVAVRDLGAAVEQAMRWRSATTGPVVSVAGPIVTAPGGYPTISWGANGAGTGVNAGDAASVTASLAQAGTDIIKIALEPAGGLPVPALDVARAVVAAAHDHGLAVSAHALTAAAVDRALAAGVDELAHVPTEPLPPALVERLAESGVTVVSTLHALMSYPESAVRENAAALIAAGVRLIYGTDFGNEGTRTGAEPRELDLLAAAGLGSEGALRAATDGAATAAGLRQHAGLGRLAAGASAALVALRGDPLDDPQRWRDPLAVVVGTQTWLPPADQYVADVSRGAAPKAPDSDASDTERVAGAAGPVGTLRALLARYRSDIWVALIVIAGSLLAGTLVGVLWEALASPARMVVVDGSARFADPDEQRWITADGWLGILGVAAGSVASAVAYLRFRTRSVALAVGLALGGLAGSYVASWVGRALGPSPIGPGLADGTVVTGPLTVHAPAVLYGWPIAALAVVIALTVGFDRPARSTQGPHR